MQERPPSATFGRRPSPPTDVPPPTIQISPPAHKRQAPITALWLLGFTAIAYSLQLVPVTGIFLMFLMAPFWSVLTVNAAMISLTVGAVRGTTWRWLLGFPILYFGGYEAVAVASHVQLAQLRAEIARDNAAAHLPFDTTHERLAARDAAEFVSRYELPVVYQHLSAPLDSGSWRAARRADVSTCRQVYDTTKLIRSGISAKFTQADRGVRECVVLTPEAPDMPVVEVTERRESLRGSLMEGEVKHIAVARADGVSVLLRAGYAAPLSWLPLPAIGCGLNDANPSWDCFAGFMHGGATALAKGGRLGGDVQAVAAALGLSTPTSSPATAPGAEVNQAMTAAEEDAIQRDLKKLAALLGGSAPVQMGSGFEVLPERPELLSSRRGEIAAAFARAVEAGLMRRYDAHELGRLIGAMSEADFRAVSPNVLASLDKNLDHPRVTRAVVDPVVIRLGDAGAQALPFLTHTLQTGADVEEAAIALCRIGTPAAAAAPSLQAVSGASRLETDGPKAAAMIALARIGRHDLIEAQLPSLQAGQGSVSSQTPGMTVTISRGAYNEIRDKIAEVGPQSPPWVCSSNKRERRLRGDPPAQR